MLKPSFFSFLLLLVFSCNDGKQSDVEATHSSTIATEAATESFDIDISDRTYIPGKRIGLIDAKSTPESIRAAYGKEALVDSLLWGPEGMRYPGYILFPGTEDALKLSFDDEAGLSAETHDEGSHWTAVGTGIRIGTRLETLNQLNEGPFSFAGFDWDYGGNVMDWKGGKLEGHRLQLAYENDSVDFNDEVNRQILGDHELSSDLPVLKGIDIKVSGLYLILE